MASPVIIAEAGINHNGIPALAFELVDAAAEAGADVVKFQTFRADAVSTVHAAKAEYQKATTDAKESQFDMIRRLELSPEVFCDLAAHCRRRKIELMSSPFDLDSIDFLAATGMKTFKIPSGQITDLPYLRRLGALGHRIILSTGMCTLDDVAAAVDVLEQAGTKRHRIALLHCTTEYPAPYDEINLKAMETLAEAFPGVPVGYSDHTPGIEIAVAATAMGAVIIEKHFTLDRHMEGPDHRASLEPSELGQMIRALRHVSQALGDGIKRPTPSELKNRDIARKSIVASRPIAAGEILTAENLTTKRPGTGLSPMLWDSVIGTPAPRALQKDDLL